MIDTPQSTGYRILLRTQRMDSVGDSLEALLRELRLKLTPHVEKLAQEIPHNTSTNVWDDTDQPVWNFNSLNSTGLVGRNESEDDGIASDTGVLDPEANEGSLGNRLMEDYDFGDDGPVKSGWSGVGTPITDQDDE